MARQPGTGKPLQNAHAYAAAKLELKIAGNNHYFWL
jgi:hypothetical protein